MKRLLTLAALIAASPLPAADLPFMWGFNLFGEIGDGTASQNPAPGPTDATGVLAGLHLTAISCGSAHTVVLASDGSAYSWGFNGRGLLGSGSTSSLQVETPVAVAGGLKFTAVSAGVSHTLALAVDGNLYAWGDGWSEALGLDYDLAAPLPVPVVNTGVLSGEVITAISAGRSSSFAVTATGKLAAWGKNSSGELGDGSTTTRRLPVLTDTSGALSGKTIVGVAAGHGHTLALASDGTVFAWGVNDEGQLGDGTTVDSLTPVAVDQTGALAGVRITALAANDGLSFALSETGQLYAWGDNTYGPLGTGDYASSLVPVAVDQLTTMAGRRIIKVSCGFDHVIALADDGSAWSWGWNTVGTLGLGSAGGRYPLPQQILTTGALSGMTVTSVAAADYSQGVLAGPSAASSTPSTSTFAFSGRRSYGANFGWMNWRWSTGSAESPALTSNVLHGKVYCANTGWLDLGDGTPDDGIQYSQSNGDTGVNHDGTGALTGFAYASSIGWVTFDQSWQNPPRLNLSSGLISGFAYSANTGWIRLDGLRTSLRHRDADLAGAGDGIDDAWEREQLAAAGRPVDLNLLGNSPGSDADSDGISDADEYLADTNPFSSTSKPGTPEISSLNTDSLTLEWPASSRRVWQIECTADLSAWDDVGSPLTIPAGRTTGAATITLPPAAPRFFFRVSPMLPLTSP